MSGKEKKTQSRDATHAECRNNKLSKSEWIDVD